jgi:hypothetical protein
MQAVAGKPGKVKHMVGYQAGIWRGGGQGLADGWHGLRRPFFGLVYPVLPPDEKCQGHKEQPKGRDYYDGFFHKTPFISSYTSSSSPAG